MTALVSLFARAYHSENCFAKVFDDSVAPRLLSQQEYAAVAENMTKGIGCFYPSFNGSEGEALRLIVNSRLAPSPLGRAAFCEDALQTAVRAGAKQYLIFAAGYDTFAYRCPQWGRELAVTEIDLDGMIKDKTARLERAGITPLCSVNYVSADLTHTHSIEFPIEFDGDKTTFCSLMGISYYLTHEQLDTLMGFIAAAVPVHSTVVFDYPDENCLTAQGDEGSKVRRELAKAAGEEMKKGWSYDKIEKLMSKHGFLIYEQLEPEQITERFFALHNKANPDSPINAAPDVNYCLAVKHRNETRH